jgi:hypothetical protein
MAQPFGFSSRQASILALIICPVSAVSKMSPFSALREAKPRSVAASYRDLPHCHKRLSVDRFDGAGRKRRSKSQVSKLYELAIVIDAVIGIEPALVLSLEFLPRRRPAGISVKASTRHNSSNPPIAGKTKN